MSTENPIFIIGSPRSGTSLIRLILTSHSEIIVPPECGFVVWLNEKYFSWSVEDAIDSCVRETFLNDLYSCRKFDTWGLDRTVIDSMIMKWQPPDYAALCSLVYRAYGQKRSSASIIWGDKNNFYIDHLPTLNEIYPKARFLHIVRDGRDVACSYREVMQQKSISPYAPQFTTNIENIAIEWSSNLLKIADFLNGLSDSRKLTVRYEDLVQHPENVLSSICDWLSLDYDPQMLKFHDINRRDQLEPILTMDWKQRTMEPISADTVGRYKALLSVEEKKRFVLTAGRTLTRFDYST